MTKFKCISTTLFVTALQLLVFCSHDAPLSVRSGPTEIRPLLKMAASLSIDEIARAEALVSGEQLSDTLSFGLLVNRTESKLYGTLTIPTGVTACKVTVLIYDDQGRKIGQGSETMTALYIDNGHMVMEREIGIESAKPRIISIRPTSPYLAVNANVPIRSAVTDSFGGTVSGYLWRIGDSSWVETNDSTITISTGTKPRIMPCSLRVIDNDGNASDTAFHLFIGVPSRMKAVFGGTFLMGSANGEEDEAPVHQVTVSSFFIDSTEVTQKEYQDILQSSFSETNFPLWDNGQGDLYPAYYLNWYDAVLYCNALSRKAGLDTVYSYSRVSGTAGDSCRLGDVQTDYSATGFRLPTEAEFEYALRGGNQGEYFWSTGSAEVSGDNYCWHVDNGGNVMHPVARKLPNAYGLYDMAGNALEWCSDWYGPYTETALVNPTGPSSGAEAVARGGSSGGLVIFCRNATRYAIDRENPWCGFRVVLPVE
jgi:formylglycine-generating enzyme required for sulfatase activity